MILGGGTPLSATCKWTDVVAIFHGKKLNSPSTFKLPGTPMCLGAMARAECHCEQQSAINPCWVRYAGERQRRNTGLHQGQSLHIPPSVPWPWLQVAAIWSWLIAALRDSVLMTGGRMRVTGFSPNLISHARGKRSCGNKAKCWVTVLCWPCEYDYLKG